MPNKINLVGKRFNRLLVIKESLERKNGKVTWNCLCDCGNKILVTSSDLTTGNTKSCGCLSKENSKQINKTHGLSKTKIYSIWLGMKSRCYNKANKRYSDWGGRGIRVCKEWQTFEGFYKDMGKSYKNGLSIDRIDNDKGYEQSNCHWATKIEQQNNKRSNRYIKFNGKIKTLSQWSKDTGIKADTIQARIDYLGWSIKKALNTLI